MDLAEELYREKAVSEANDFTAYGHYTKAVSLLEGCPSEEEALAIAEEKMNSTKIELDSTYHGLEFSYKKALKLGNYVRVLEDLERILRIIPDQDDERHKEASVLRGKLRQYMSQ